MPMHNWKSVTAGTYPFFHHRWISAISDHLNAGLLPSGLFAMAEQMIGYLYFSARLPLDPNLTVVLEKRHV